MKTESPMFRSLGVLVAVLMFIALPSSTVLASCGQTADVDVEWYYDAGTAMHFELEVANPTGTNIYYTVTLGDTNVPDDPTFDPGTGAPTGSTLVCYNCTSGRDIPIPYKDTLNVKAIAWKTGIPCHYPSVNISSGSQHNPNL